MWKRIKINTKHIGISFLKCWSVGTAILSAILTFFTWEDLKLNSVPAKLIFFIVCVIVAVLSATVLVITKNERDIFGNINKGVSIRYGDIIDLGFTNEQKKIVVIPVNRCFDMTCENNLIMERSIHGQWMSHYFKNENERQNVIIEIQNKLDTKKVEHDLLTREEKPAGNQKRYKPGTVVELKNKNVRFYLLAIASLNEDLKAYCSEVEYYETMQGLIEYYDKYGAGDPIYCPVMGDNIILPPRDTTDLIHLMLSILRVNKNNIRGKFNLVVFHKMREDISLLDY